jgi:hypothetical protein
MSNLVSLDIGGNQIGEKGKNILNKKFLVDKLET